MTRLAQLVSMLDSPTTECVSWPFGHSSDGYGVLSTGPGKTAQAHRVAYELMVGPIPVGLEVDHLCRKRDCVNPAHLEPVTGAENTRRHWLTRTHCKQGHLFDEANTYRLARATGPRRHCRACNRAAVRRYAARRKLP